MDTFAQFPDDQASYVAGEDYGFNTEPCTSTTSLFSPPPHGGYRCYTETLLS